MKNTTHESWENVILILLILLLGGMYKSSCGVQREDLWWCCVAWLLGVSWRCIGVALWCRRFVNKMPIIFPNFSNIYISKPLWVPHRGSYNNCKTWEVQKIRGDGIIWKCIKYTFIYYWVGNGEMFWGCNYSRRYFNEVGRVLHNPP